MPGPRSVWLRQVVVWIALTTGGLPSLAWALMVGATPDTPAAHVDANAPASPWSGAVAVKVNGEVHSGVVIAPSYVLTAAHVVAGASAAALQVQVNAGATPQNIAVSAVTTHPAYSFPDADLAVLRLATPVPASVTIWPIFHGPLSTPRRITLVGYGASGTGDAGVSVGPQAGVKRVGYNTLDGFSGTWGLAADSWHYVFDFDGASGNGLYGAGTIGNTLEVGLASRDSGGPAYVEAFGRVYLLGIHNAINGDYRFGTGGLGIALNDGRYDAWLNTQTAHTLPMANGDVPWPAWALASLAASLAATLGTRRSRVSRAATTD